MFKKILWWIDDKFDDLCWFFQFEVFTFDALIVTLFLVFASYALFSVFMYIHLIPPYVSVEQECQQKGGHLSTMAMIYNSRYGGDTVKCMRDGEVVELSVRRY